MTDDIAATPARSRRPNVVREVALTLGAAAGLCCLVVMVAVTLFGVTPLVFRSGSMEPTIPTGALAFSRDVDAIDIKSGDVVSVENQRGIRITHRVVSVDSSAGDAVAMTLRGDANGVADAQTYVVTSAQRVVFHIDRLGYVVAWFDTLAGKILCGIVAGVLLWIIAFPHGRRRSGTSRDREASDSAPGTRGASTSGVALSILALTAVTAVGVGQFRGTAAAYTDSAGATTGSFAARADFVPRIDEPVGTIAYVTCENSPTSSRGTPTLKWAHVGPPYQYRILLRNTVDGAVWRTFDVVPSPTAAAGSTVSAALNGAGLPASAATTSYNAEIHTMLPGGAVSPGWRGYRVYTEPSTLFSDSMRCTFILPLEINGTGAYVPPPNSISCVTNTSAKTATISWPHLSGYTYQTTVRDPTSNNIAYTASINTPSNTAAGQAISTTISFSNLTSGSLTGTAARVEVRSQASNGNQSTGYVSYNVTASSANGVACASLGPTAARVAPTTPSSPTSTSTTPAEPAGPSAAPAPSAPTPSAPAPSEPAPSTPAPSEPAPSDAPAASPTTPLPTEPNPAPEVPAEQPISSVARSASGDHSAQVLESADGAVLVIRDASDDEEFRVSTSADAVVEWVGTSDELRVRDSSGDWSISRASGSWVKSPYAQPLPAAPAADEETVAEPTVEAEASTPDEGTTES